MRLAALVGLVVLVSVGFIYAPFLSRRAEAQFTTVEAAGPLLTGVIQGAAAGSITAAYSAAQSSPTPVTPRDILSSLLIITAKTAIDSLTQSIVNWINTGFEGSPAFVTDLERNLGNLSDAVANDFINGLNQVVISNTGINIRAPFQDQIARQLREEFYRTTSSYGFDLRHPYNPNCYGSSGNFTIGGFLCQSQNPNNNAYGRYQIARNELFKRLDTEAQNRIAELGWGRGFLPWRGTCGPFGNKIPTATSTDAVNLGAAETNRKCAVRTPGAVIEEQLTNVLGSGVRQLELADNFNEIVSALVSQLLNQVLGGSGLSGASQPQTGGGQSFVNSSGSVGSQLFAQSISDTQEQVARYRENWQRLEAESVRAGTACINDDTKSAEADRVTALARSREQEASQFLNELSSIEAERARLTASGTTSAQLVEALAERFKALMRNLGQVSSDTASLIVQMQTLAASCD